MKFFILGTFLFSTASFAQSLDLNALKNLLTSRQATLEKVNPGMSKKMITTASEGDCTYRVTSIQSVLKIEGERIIVLSKEKFQPQNSAGCRDIGYTSSVDQSILYYEAKPSLANDLAALNELANDIKIITRVGDQVVINLQVSEEKITLKYDLTKPSFKNLISSQSIKYSIFTEEMSDVDLSTVDLKKVLFCDNSESDRTECVEGDFSDILF